VQATEARARVGGDVLEDGSDIRTVQELLGHKDVKTTMVYTHVLNRRPAGVRSPADSLSHEAGILCSSKKEFDAVGTMREIRDRLSNQIEGMTFEEEKLFIRKHVAQRKAHHPEEPPNFVGPERG
jgi:hypothetical protein